MDTRGEMTVAVTEDVRVAAKPQRRTYTAEYKRRILREADACTTPGAIGALLRREGCTPPTWSCGEGPAGAGNWRL
jgi:hypothetical protein